MLSGEKLKEFKNSLPNDIGEPLKFVPQLILWTEKGASRMCKILDTDKAWERFDELEETYFKVKENSGNIKYIDRIEKTKCEIGLIDVIANSLHLNDNSKLQLMEKSFKKNDISTDLLPDYTESKGVLKSVTELLKINNINMSAQKFNALLIEKGVLKECTRPSTKTPDKVKKFKNLIDTTYGENLVNPRNNKETQPMYYENKFSELLEYVGIGLI